LESARHLAAASVMASTGTAAAAAGGSSGPTSPSWRVPLTAVPVAQGLARAKSAGQTMTSRPTGLEDVGLLPGNLTRSSSVRLPPIRQPSLSDEEGGRWCQHEVSQEAQIGLVTALEAAANRMELFVVQLDKDRSAAAEREKSLVRALEAAAEREKSIVQALEALSAERVRNGDPETGAGDGRTAAASTLGAHEEQLLQVLQGLQAQLDCSREGGHGPQVSRRVDEECGSASVISTCSETWPSDAPKPSEGWAATIQELLNSQMRTFVHCLRMPGPGSHNFSRVPCGCLAGLGNSIPLSGKRQPEYRPSIGRDGHEYEFPEVEVAIKVYQVGNVDTAQLTFEADFVCHLDWSDPNVEGLSNEELRALDWSRYFNPYVDIDNSKDTFGWLAGADELPRRRGTASMRRLSGISGLSEASELHDDDGSKEMGPALRKTMRFRGHLSVSSVNLRCFPFDFQVLPVRLKAARCRGLTVRGANAAVHGDEAESQPPVSPSKSTRVHLTHSRVMLQDEAYRHAARRLRGRGHFAVPTADEALLGFHVRGITGCHPDPDRGDVYEVSILVERPFPGSYIYDLVIMNLLVGLAASAFWDTAAPELSSRMSISLTVILTLAAYTSSRPTPIEKAPYVTYHDWCEQMCMLLVTGISVQNVLAVVTCGGQHEEAPPYMTEMFERHSEECSVGWCLSRRIDCQGLLLLLGAWITLNVYSLFWLLRMRHHAKNWLHKRVPPSGADMEDFEPQASDLSASIRSWSFRCRRCFSWSSRAMWQRRCAVARGALWRCLCCLCHCASMACRRHEQVEVAESSADASAQYAPAASGSPMAPSRGAGAADGHENSAGRPQPLGLSGGCRSSFSAPGFLPSPSPTPPHGQHRAQWGRACPSPSASTPSSPSCRAGSGSYHVMNVSRAESPRPVPQGLSYLHLND